MSGPVRRVTVLGGGVAAAMAALAAARAFGRLGVKVIWVERGETVPAHAALVAPPDLAAFHRLLGIDEAALVTRAGATLNMGQQFAGWSGGEAMFLHAYGDAGSAFASLPFVQHWSRARAAGLGVALEDFCLAAAAAKQGRTGLPREGAAQAVKHGYHLDAARYAALLRERCVEAGVAIRETEPAEADLIIDADDGGATGAPWCDRLVRASAPALQPPPLFSRVTAHRAGWTTLIPLSDRLAIEQRWSSAFMGDAEAVALLGEGVQLGEVERSEASSPQGWTGNRVTIGGAAPPLDGAEMLLLQLSIAQLILLWPIDREAMPEAEIYNEEMAGTRARVNDFTAQHFRLCGRTEPYWEQARAAPISPELAAKIDLFAARGLFAHFNHEAHVEDAWALVMAGHGIVPRSFDPQAARVDEQTLMIEFKRQLGAVATAVRSMETHAQALARIARGAR